MKNIVIINGSPRRKGNSALLAEALKQDIGNLLSDRIDVQTFFLAQQDYFDSTPVTPDSDPGSLHFKKSFAKALKVAPCKGCQACSKTGECIIKSDDMNKLINALDTADALIWISPLYFGTVTAQLKAVIDRMQVFWARNATADNPSGIAADRSRPAIALYVAAHNDPFSAKIPGQRPDDREEWNQLPTSSSRPPSRGLGAESQLDEQRKGAALVPLRFASNTAGFNLVGYHAVIGPEHSGDIAKPEFAGQFSGAVAFVLEHIAAS